MSWVIQLLAFVPKNAISQAFGWFVQIEFPAPLNVFICKFFAWLYGINIAEAEAPIESYRTLQDFFTRSLRPGIRPVGMPLVSTADGTLVYSQSTEQGGRALQVKGIYYNLDELVYGQVVTAQNDWAWYTTVYLAPYDYHRVHAPVTGRLEQIRYFPGELWPVNELFVKYVPQLFSTNERLVFDFTLSTGGKVAVAMVGALNVGRIKTPFWPDFFTNDRLFGLYPKTRDFGANAPLVNIGDEIGTFMLGSTTVVVLDERARQQLAPKTIQAAVTVKMGESLTELKTPLEGLNA